MLTGVNLEEAQEILLSFVTSLYGESVALLQASGRVVARDLFAAHDLPFFMQSAVDGYAVPVCRMSEEDGSVLFFNPQVGNFCALAKANSPAGSDVNQAGLEPVTGAFDSLYGKNSRCKSYLVREQLKPGEIPQFPLSACTAAGVVTGGALPAGTGAVIPQELAQVTGNFVAFKEEILPGDNIKLSGEDFRARDLLVRRGSRFTPGLAAVLAAFGKSEAEVFRRPRVAVLSLGPEIVPAQVNPEPGKIRDSNGPLLAALAKCDGADVTCVETASVSVKGMKAVGDANSSHVKYVLEKLLAQADIVLTSGGTADGVCDQALYLLRHIGARPLFWGVKIKPGSHSGAAVSGKKMVISLSGNPAACAAGYHLLVAPVLRALQGLNPNRQRVSAVTENSFLKKGGPRRFVQGYVECGQDGWKVTVLPGQKSSMLRAVINCNALIELSAGHPFLEKGDRVNVLLLDPMQG